MRIFPQLIVPEQRPTAIVGIRCRYNTFNSHGAKINKGPCRDGSTDQPTTRATVDVCIIAVSYCKISNGYKDSPSAMVG